MTVAQALGQLARLDDAELIGVLDATFAARPGLRLVRDDLLAVVQSGLAAATARDGMGPTGQHPTVGAELVKQLRIEAAARAGILAHSMLDAGQVADLLASTGRNRRDTASALRRRGRLVGLGVAGRSMYPAFQIDASRARVRPIVAELNTALHARTDPWGAAGWWLTPSGRLPTGQSPADLAVAGEVDTLRALAQALLSD